MRSFLILAIMSALAVGFAGCSKKTCETIADECNANNDFEDACIDDYKDGGSCRDALKDFRKCVEDEGCDGYDCIPEFESVLYKCDKISELSYY